MAIFQSFWHGGALPLFARHCIDSFVRAGHDYHLYTYDEIDTPAGVDRRDAGEILPKDRIFYYKNEDGSNRSIACFANLFRYKLLRQKGNWWVDTDVFYLGGRIPQSELYFGWQDDKLICNAILKFSAGHPVLAEIERQCEAAGTILTWGQTGPHLCTDVISNSSVRRLVYPQPFAYPVGWKDHEAIVKQISAAPTRAAIENLPFLHIWHEMFRRKNPDALNNPETGSVWRELMTRPEDPGVRSSF